MPESKTIEIDEIITPGKPPGDTASSRSGAARRQTSRSGAATGSAPSSADAPFPSGDPFADFQRTLPWKARWTLRLTRWFMLLRGKPWGKLVIVPAVLLGIMLAIPLGLLFFFFLIIRSFLRSLR